MATSCGDIDSWAWDTCRDAFWRESLAVADAADGGGSTVRVDAVAPINSD